MMQIILLSYFHSFWKILYVHCLPLWFISLLKDIRGFGITEYIQCNEAFIISLFVQCNSKTALNEAIKYYVPFRFAIGIPMFSFTLFNFIELFLYGGPVIRI